MGWPLGRALGGVHRPGVAGAGLPRPASNGALSRCTLVGWGAGGAGLIAAPPHAAPGVE